MSETPQAVATPPISVEKTPLAAHLATGEAIPYRGALAIRKFSAADAELAALTGHAGIFDLGYRAFVKIIGSDRIRWMNGMVTNTIQGLAENHGNYSFLLNAQGRILGDATIHCLPDSLLLQTDRSQIASILAHLDHFIIMDDVELQPLDASFTAIGIAGPKAAEILASLGLESPPAGTLASTKWQNAEINVTADPSRFELLLPAAVAPALWSAIVEAGAKPSGTEASEALRILNAEPLYSVDIRDRHLPQETAQTQALNFNKGCYLGQEIVERIRSRATVHRTFKQFSLSGTIPALEPGQTLSLEAEGVQQNPVGEISSLAHYNLPGFTGTLALGFIRTETLERKLPITCAGATVTVLERPPLIAS
jgi:folate-binding protein YgfZ